MGRQNGAWCSADRRVRRQRLLREDVERGPGDRPALERGCERVGVDHLAARRVHHDRGALHLRQGLFVDQAAGLVGERDVQRDNVRGAQDLIEIDETRAGGARRRLGREGIVRHDRHAEGCRAPRHLAADTADADEPEDLRAQLVADELRARPLPGTDAAVGVDDPPHQRERQRDRVLRRGDDVSKRRVHHVDAAGGRGGNVDVIDPDTGAADDDQARRRIEDGAGDLRFAADDERVDVAEARGQVGLFQAGGLANLAAGAEQRETLFRERVRDVDDVLSASDGTRPRRARDGRRCGPRDATAAGCSPRRPEASR